MNEQLKAALLQASKELAIEIAVLTGKKLISVAQNIQGNTNITGVVTVNRDESITNTNHNQV